MHGGNMDNKELVADTTVYYPINAKGALFEVGDGHANQGNGEVDITALETQLTGAFQFIVPKELRGKSADEANWFLGLLEAIVLEMTANSGLSDANGNPYLDAASFAITNGPMPCDQDFSPMYFWGADYLVETP